VKDNTDSHYEYRELTDGFVDYFKCTLCQREWSEYRDIANAFICPFCGYGSEENKVEE